MFETGLNWLLLAQTDSSADAVAGISPWLVLAVIVAIFVLPIALGTAIARLLRLKDLATRISVVLFAVTLGTAPFAWHIVQGKLEMLRYEAALAEWKGRANRKSNNITPEDKGVEELEMTLPNLTIKYSVPSPPAVEPHGTNSPSNPR